jgi:hypothetical protein
MADKLRLGLWMKLHDANMDPASGAADNRKERAKLVLGGRLRVE